MAAPSSAITRQELGATFTEFDLRMNIKGYIGAQVLRPRVVGVPSANIGKVPLAQLLQSVGIGTTQRNPGSGYKRDSFTFDKYAYAVQEFGKEEVLDDAHKAMYGDMLDMEEVHAMRAMDAVLNEYERDVAAAVYNTTTWTGSGLTTAIVNEWDDFANADPQADVAAASEKVAAGSGMEPNTLIISNKVLRNLLQVAAIKDQIKYTQTPTPNVIRSTLADLFGLRNILVAGGFKNTADPGQAVSLSRIWSEEYAMVCRVAETDDPAEPCIGRTFIWPGDGPGAIGADEQLAVLMEEYREDAVRGDVMRARNNRDIVIMYAAAGHLLSNVTT